MIKTESFSSDWINQKHEAYQQADPQLIERFIYAFELLGCMVKYGQPFTFRGGPAMTLHLPELRRLSIDIDIIGDHTAEQVSEAMKHSVFTSVEEDKRTTSTIPKTHYKCYYKSNVVQNPTYVLLDVLKSKEPYHQTVPKLIESPLFVCDTKLSVQVPTLDGLLADKLTAFAPNTIGIRHGTGKTMEIIKQVFDIGQLFPGHSDPNDITATYHKVVEVQAGILKQSLSSDQSLDDTIRSAFFLCQMDIRNHIQNNATEEFRSGIKQIRSHLLHKPFSLTEAKIAASRAALLAALLRYGNNPWRPIEVVFSQEKLHSVIDLTLDGKLQKLSRLKEVLPECFFNWVHVEHISSNLKETELS